eukprot:6203375-Pleurochrysis_carterae.AAC.5
MSLSNALKNCPDVPLTASCYLVLLGLNRSHSPSSLLSAELRKAAKSLADLVVLNKVRDTPSRVLCARALVRCSACACSCQRRRRLASASTAPSARRRSAARSSSLWGTPSPQAPPAPRRSSRRGSRTPSASRCPTQILRESCSGPPTRAQRCAPRIALSCAKSPDGTAALAEMQCNRGKCSGSCDGASIACCRSALLVDDCRVLCVCVVRSIPACRRSCTRARFGRLRTARCVCSSRGGARRRSRSLLARGGSAPPLPQPQGSHARRSERRRAVRTPARSSGRPLRRTAWRAG